MSLQVCLSVVAISLVYPTSAMVVTQHANQDLDCEILLIAAENEISRFKWLNVWMSKREGPCASKSDAKRGQFQAQSACVNSKVRWAFHGKLQRYDLEYDAKEIERFTRKEGAIYTTRYATQFAVTNDEIELGDGPYQDIQLSRRDTFHYIGAHPLNIGMGAPFPIRVREIVKAGGTARLAGTYRFDNRELPMVEACQGAGDRKQIDRYVIDPDRGHTVLKVETLFTDDKEPSHLFEVVELRDFGDGRWVPTHFRFMTLNDTPVYLCDFRVERIELGQPPPEDTFVLKVTPGKKGYNRFHKTWFVCKTGKVPLTAFRSDGTLLPNPDIEVWTPGSQRNLATSTSAKVDRPPATSEVAEWPFGPQPEDSTMRWWLAALAAVLAIAAIVIWRLKKK